MHESAMEWRMRLRKRAAIRIHDNLLGSSVGALPLSYSQLKGIINSFAPTRSVSVVARTRCGRLGGSDQTCKITKWTEFPVQYPGYMVPCLNASSSGYHL